MADTPTHSRSKRSETLTDNSPLALARRFNTNRIIQDEAAKILRSLKRLSELAHNSSGHELKRTAETLQTIRVRVEDVYFKAYSALVDELSSPARQEPVQA